MYGNSGYVGFSRSVRSERAISDFEVPLSMIKKDLLHEFLRCNDGVGLEEEDISLLEKISVSRWKAIAKEVVGASSWHHTGKLFKETDHYSLDLVAEKMIELGVERINTIYSEYLQEKKEKEQQKNFKYGVIKVQVWGGTRKRPTIVGYDTRPGIIIGDWLYYYGWGKISKYSTSANRVEYVNEYDTYAELVKNNKEFKGKRKELNDILRDRKMI